MARSRRKVRSLPRLRQEKLPEPDLSEFAFAAKHWNPRTLSLLVIILLAALRDHAMNGKFSY